MEIRKVISLSVIGAAVGITLFSCSKKSDSPTEAPPIKVTAIAVADSTFKAGSVFSGTVASAGSSTVSFAVTGTIEQLNVSEGDRVVQGQLLGRLKDGDYVNADNIARAELAEAEDAYTRMKKLHDANALPDVKWVEIQQKVAQARNAVEITARALGQTRLYAPISGVISRKLADRGQNVAPIEPVYEIVTTDALNVDIAVPENEIEKFELGQQAVVEFGNNDAAPLKAKVVRKAVVADPLTRSYKVELALPSGSKSILPGMVVQVIFDDTRSEVSPSTAVMLPSQAVELSDDNTTFVWVVKSSRAERRDVVVDELVAGGILVKDGLLPGDTVIVAGMQKVGTGSIVDAVIK